jgi:Fe-S cluster assembly protein SufD
MPVRTAPSPFHRPQHGVLAGRRFLHVPNGIEIETPIHLLFLSQPAKAPWCRIRAISSCGFEQPRHVIEHYASTHGGEYFTNTVTEIVAGKNANIDHYKLQLESEAAFHCFHNTGAARARCAFRIAHV